jgi:hypothetical protein
MSKIPTAGNSDIKHKEKHVFSFGGFKTSQKFLDQGMYVCFSCGELGSVDHEHCSYCGEVKFIVKK